jgi:hypothetical protein
MFGAGLIAGSHVTVAISEIGPGVYHVMWFRRRVASPLNSRVRRVTPTSGDVSGEGGMLSAFRFSPFRGFLAAL